ncbi:spatacsin-like isoform X2 [Mercenaria mercenaria]|uniref:spatacsin-like isoform X2 n=1 Tax=Mercenaria mercenaria TaxID=6596 RepID=UPI00234E490C|nr:spatacsin-like isoform X2 [Mercenaria mercenaria]
MAEETRETESCFRFILQKLTQQHEIQKLKTFRSCIKSRCFVALLNDNRLIISSFQNAETNAVEVVENVEGFAIQTDVETFGKGQIAVISKSRQLQIYENRDGNYTIQEEIDMQSAVTKDIPDMKSAEIALFKGENITMCINETVLLQLVIKDHQCNVISKIVLPESQNYVNKYLIIGDICVVLDTNRLLFYSVSEGEVLRVIDLSLLPLDTASIQAWTVSDHFTYLALVLQSGDIHLIDLQSYCSTSPQVLQQGRRSQQQRDHSYLSTCQYGDIPWREKLLSMHRFYKSSQTQTYPLAAPKISTKKHSKVTGFWSKTKHEAENMQAYVTVLRAADSVHGYCVEDICLDEKSVSVVYCYNDVYVMCQREFSSQKWNLYRLKEGERIVLSRDASLPHAVITEKYLEGMITRSGMDQEQFVNELMVYGGAALADTVCHLNNWGRSSMPIHTLQVGLKHRQLDTVTFFLKSKEKIFTSTHSSMLIKDREGSDTPAGAPYFSHVDTLLQLEPAVNLILDTIKGTIGDKHSHMFGKEVLDSSMDFLYELLLDSLAVSETVITEQENIDLQQATEKLLEYIEKTRECIRMLEQRTVLRSSSESTSVSSGSVTSPTSISTSTPSDGLAPNNTSLFSNWDQMDIETVIEDGVMKNVIPDLQQYLLQKKEYSRAGYSEIKSTCVALATNYIKYGNMDKAKEIFMKLGLTVSEELWKIALYTLDITICNSITEELITTSQLNKDQIAMVTFFKELNVIYPCRNFEEIQKRHHHVKDSESHEVHRLKNLINQTSKFDLTESCGNLTFHSSEDSGQNQYNEVILDWLHHWDSTTRDLVLLDILLHKPGSDISRFNKVVIWEYLLSRNMGDVLVAWIHNSFSDNQAGCAGRTEPGWPVTHLGKITADYVNQTDQCTDTTRKQVLKAFARYGVFSHEALANFQVLLKQLNEIGGPLQLPHPLNHCEAAVLSQFHCDMIQYCIQHNLQYFLWLYVHYHRLDAEWLTQVCDSYSNNNWLPLFLKFISVTKAHIVRPSMFEGSLTNAVAVWGEQGRSVGELLKSGHTLAALATLMYSQHKLQQVTFVTQQLEAFDGLSSETVEGALQGYPKLQVTLFPASVTDLPHTDVSVYQLLIGNAPFDPAKLFGWQTTNTCAGEDSIQEMPYFSHSGLVAKYGYSEHLKYNYYLKQARPSFAFITFLAEEFKNGGSTLPAKRLAVAIGTSLWIGVKHFHNPQISSSCVIFQELLGHDSLMLRLYIHVGCKILAYRNQAVTGTMDKRREQVKRNEHDVVEMLLDCIQIGRQFAPTVLGALEAATLAAITREKLQLYSYEASQHWTIAVLFCHLHYLPYTTVFLESCAEAKQWLPFIWFSQIHQFPKEQLQNLLHKFQSSYLQEHLRYILANAELRTTQAEEKKVQVKHRSERVAKDVRSNLYSRIGLVKGGDSEASSTSDDEEGQARMMGNLKDDDNLDEDIVLEVTHDSAPCDVFGVVFASQATKYPWKSLLLHAITLRNCLFAELAASLDGASVLPCLSSWLVAVMDVTEHTQFLEDYGKSPWRYTMHTLDAILDLFISKKWGSLLVTGFDIFQQSSPLLPFLQFYAEFSERQNYRNCRLLLDEFKESVFQFNHEKSVRVLECIGDSDWLERTTYRIIQYMLTSTPSVHKVAQLLKILDSESITLVFKHVDPDFRRQSQMLQCIEEGEIEQVNFSALLTASSQQYEKECLSVIDQLMNKQKFGEARKFAKITGICAHHVTIRQLKQEKERLSSTDLWQSRHARFKFYRDCTIKFRKHEIPPEKIADFFKNEGELIDLPAEKADIYDLCLHCMEQQGSVGNTDCWAEIYRNMWLNRIKVKLESKTTPVVAETKLDLFSDTNVTDTTTSASIKTELMFCGKMPRSSDEPDKLTEDEVRAVQQLVGELLHAGKVSESCRLLTEFNVYSQDLAIVLTCIRLSMGTLSLDTMSPDMLHLLRSRPGNIHRQSIAAPVALLRNSSTISLMSNIQPVIDSVSVENEAKISAMECLLNHLNNGRQTCIRIITAFKIAAVLYIGYDDVITGDDFFILKSLLKTNCSAKFRLSADFLGTSSLSAQQVAGFLSDAILQSYKVSVGDTDGGQELFFDPGENFADFHQIVRLCQEPSLLGNRLVDSVASMSGNLEQVNDKVLTLQTELLILAHECYTASCDMEGISNILRAARILTAHLQAAGEHQLMTRLLTGVGRYNEMTYIFDALQQNHQFELLLGKGKEKETKLKTAILDYLKRYHPGDTDTYTMVALKFMMYREIAQLLEHNANKTLDKLKGKPLENTSDTQGLLQKVAQFLSEAAESYIKDNCLRHAQACVRKARLVALQVKYLPSNQQFINLTTKGANLLIADHPVFTEAYIISEAYKQKDNWALALCNNVIKLGNMKYLQDFRSHIRITPTLVEDAVDRYQQCADKTPQAPANIKKLLQFCKDVKVQYRIAKQLSLRDVVMNLEKGDAKSYIMDFSMS